MLTTSRRHRIASLIAGVLISTGASALDVNVVGLFPNKAVVQVEGGPLRTLSVGQRTRDDVVLLSVERDGATFDIQGKRVVLALGSARTQPSSAAAANPPSPATISSAANYSTPASYPTTANYATVPSNGRGDMVADGEVNGVRVRFMVDTGASFITLPAREAARLGLEYRNGQKIMMETANGDVLGHRVKLDTVRVGDIALRDIDAVVIDGKNLSSALLGMSFLNRVDMKREGTTLTLTKRD